MKRNNAWREKSKPLHFDFLEEFPSFLGNYGKLVERQGKQHYFRLRVPVLKEFLRQLFHGMVHVAPPVPAVPA